MAPERNRRRRRRSSPSAAYSCSPRPAGARPRDRPDLRGVPRRPAGTSTSTPSATPLLDGRSRSTSSASLLALAPGLPAQRRRAGHRAAGCAPTSRTRSTRCRCSYFDQQPRGELLSRVTNDIDNISQTLQQTMSQLLTSLLTVVVRAGDDVLDLAGAGAGRAGLGAALDGRHGAVMKRSQGQFIAQWRRTGKLNAHIEETFSGHALVKVFGRRQRSSGTSPRRTRSSTRPRSGRSS